MFKDPFGRLLAKPKPDREILNFQNPVFIRDSIGMEGMNSRRDVAKVENLLGRAGALDLPKTDGVTGFFGARTDEAVRAFQKDRGLKVDGLVNPHGPTMRTLVAEAGHQITPKPPPGPSVPQTLTADPRKENIRNFALRLQNMQKNGIDPKAQNFANTGDEKGDSNAPSTPATPEANPEVPAYRKDVFLKQKGAWEEYNRSVGELPGITPTEKIILPQIFAAEGGLRNDPDSSASSGILQGSLDRAKKSGKVPGIENAQRPADLTVPQRAAVAKFYFDDTLRTVGGGKALDTIGNKKAAGAFADTLFRHGRRKGTEIIQDAVNKTRKEQGLSQITPDGKMGPETLSAYREAATGPEGRMLLFEKLRKRRGDFSKKTETPRIDFFLPPDGK